MIHIARGHVDFGPQDVRPFRKFPSPHALEQIEVFLNRAHPIRTVLARFGEVPR